MARESQLDMQTLQQNLPEIIRALEAGEEVTIMDKGQPVARLLRSVGAARCPRVPGSARGKLRVLVDDDEHLADFADYMP